MAVVNETAAIQVNNFQAIRLDGPAQGDFGYDKR